jgi:uncharacterized HAD superfamily protein
LKRLGVDVDGILANFFTGYENLIVSISGEDRFPADTLPPVWNWPQHYGYSEEVVAEAWRQIKASEDFWLCLPAFAQTDRFLEKLVSSDHEVYFITDRPGKDPQWQTAKWIENGGLFLPSVIVTGGAPKSAIANALRLDVMIDDKPENIQDLVTNFGGYTFAIKYPYNANTKITDLFGNFKFVENLDEFWMEANL